MKLVRNLALATAVLASAGVSACATAPAPGPVVAAFDVAAFAWSTAVGTNSLEGQMAYAGGGRRWACAGSVGLVPETAWTRQRFQTLYGSTDRAAIPAAIVQARTVAEASADYRTFVRSTTCDPTGRFAFSGLPDGAWFVIAQTTSEGADPVVLMRRVETRGGRTVAVRLD